MKQLEEMDVIIWRVFASVMAGILAVSMVKAVLGTGAFPWRHLATLAIAWKMGDCTRFFRTILAGVRRILLRGCATPVRVTSRVKSAAKDYSLARKQGRLRRAPALFTVNPNKQI